jgi:menaquinone-dependent protoporphyrinogen IX oxidase
MKTSIMTLLTAVISLSQLSVTFSMSSVKNDPDGYDIVVIGTPIWNHTVSTPVRTYISQYKGSFKKVAFFCTADSKDDSPFEEMEELCGKKPVATLRLTQKQEVETGRYVEKTEEFVTKIKT